MPVDIVVAFDDGSETRESWDGLERWYRIDITSTQRARVRCRRPGPQAAARRQPAQQLAHAHARDARHRPTGRALGPLAAGRVARPERFLNAARLPLGARRRRAALAVGERVLGLVTALFGVAFALASGAWLDDALEGSLATRTLLRSIDANVLVDLWYHHREGLRMLLVVGGAARGRDTRRSGGGCTAWSSPRCSARHSGMPPDLDRAALELAPVMAQAVRARARRVLALFSPRRRRRIRADALDALQTRQALDLVPDRRRRPPSLWVVGYVFLVAVHDHARLRAAAHRRRRAGVPIAGRSASSCTAASAPSRSPALLQLTALLPVGSPIKRSG